jgi:hypothetical protein
LTGEFLERQCVNLREIFVGDWGWRVIDLGAFLFLKDTKKIPQKNSSGIVKF